MTAPPRLLSDPSATPFERDLLASWSAEQPSDAARLRAIALAGGAVASAATAAAAGSLAPKAAAVASAALLKWTLLGAVLVAGGAATVAVVTRAPQRASTPSPTATATAPAMVTTASLPTATAGEAPVEPPTISPGDLPAAVEAPAPLASGSSPVHARPAAAAPPPRESSLAEEIALFDRARAALAGGDANRALALLDYYEGRFRTGAFAQEAEVLRVQALVRKGDRATANRVGERFLAAHPTSPHAARVRAILESSSP